jgi:uncharacterized protein YprB with RNaseH-like and TPR domain
MVSDNEKWARISALRPSGGPAPVSEAFRRPDRLPELLGAEVRTNEAGSHLIVRNAFPEPKEPAFRPETFRLLTANLSSTKCDARKWLFLDTETTGLAGGTGTYAFLIGIAWWDESGFCVEQYFMRHPGEEKSMLQALAARLGRDRVLVTFNGKSFDWPLLETRYRLCRSGIAECPPIHLDLLYPSRQLWKMRLSSLALSELEKHILALDRGPDIPAETIPARYFQYLRAGIAEPLVEVFRHNQMDLRGLAALSLTIARILENPLGAAAAAEEIFGVSRMLQRAGECSSAEDLYLQALEIGLPKAAGRIARRELAGMARKRKDFDQANVLWQDLLGESPDAIEAYEQMAIHCEHRTREIERAIGLTRQALVKLQDSMRAGRISMATYRNRHAALQHRLSRLEEKKKNHQDTEAQRNS